MARFRALFTGFSLLLLVFGSLLSVPAVSAQVGQGVGDSAKHCANGGYRSAYTISVGGAVGFSSTSECVTTAAHGGEIRTSYLTYTLVAPQHAIVMGAGLLPNAPITHTATRWSDGVTTVSTGKAVLPDGTWEAEIIFACGTGGLTSTYSTATILGATISATYEWEGC